MEISRDTFKDSDNSTQNLILYDSIQDLCEKIDKKNICHDDEHLKLKRSISRSGKVNGTLSAGSGLFGGFLAVITSKIFGL